MIFMTKSKHRRAYIAKNIASTLEPESLDTTAVDFPSERSSRGEKSKFSRALIVVVILTATAAILILPMIYWLS